MRPVIIVFAKAPVPLRVKTRLIPRVGVEAACRLHCAFVDDTLTAVGSLADRCDVEVHTDDLTGTWKPTDVMKAQVSGNLGTRMLAALSAALQEGRPIAAILGSDSPTIPIAHLESILECPADVCLGPATDGGFYAIGCRRTSPLMFDGVPWSMPDTLEKTRLALEKAALTSVLGLEWYDIDSGDDLDRLIADPYLRPATRLALEEAGVLADGRPR